MRDNKKSRELLDPLLLRRVLEKLWEVWFLDFTAAAFRIINDLYRLYSLLGVHKGANVYRVYGRIFGTAVKVIPA